MNSRSFRAVVVSLSVACAGVPAWSQDAASPDIAPPAAVLPAAVPVTDAVVNNAIANVRETLVIAANPPLYTLGIGSDDGAQRGAVYGVTANGQTRVRIQITEVRPTDSIARLLDNQEDFQLAVGDAVQLLNIEKLPDTPTTTAPTTPATPPTTTPATTPATTTPATTSPATVEGTGNTSLIQPAGTSGGAATPSATLISVPAPAAITAIDGTAVTFNAGTARGVQTGDNLSILRGTTVIAVLRVQTATAQSSTGTVMWRDENAAPIAVGDAVGVLSTPAISADPGLAPVKNTAVVVSTPIRFETGASNVVVPRADYTYELLAALASSGLITRYPAYIFHDDGTRRHRTEEDITFTRAQIADLIREAMESDRAENATGRTAAALRILVRDYARELSKQGVEADTLTQGSKGAGFTLGVSGQQRLTLAGGDTGRDLILPFSERQGGLRTRSGYDTRTNIFATAGDRLTFRGTIDAGSKTGGGRAIGSGGTASGTGSGSGSGSGSGISGSGDKSFEVRRALLSYDAGRLLRGLTIEAGRDERWWGPGHFGTLLLSDVAGPLNMISTTFKRGSYQLESLYAPLGRGPGGGSRALYGQNLSAKIGSQSRIGFANTVLDPTNKLNPLLFAATFSPFPVFLAERRAGGGSGQSGITARDGANILLQAYAETSVARGMQLYGELLIDDAGFDDLNLTRNRIGTLLGTHIFTPEDPTKLGVYAEYANLQYRTYLNLGQGPDYDYFYRGQPLGYPVAPFGDGNGGAESLRAEAYWRPTLKLRLTAGFEFADLNSEQPILTRQQVYRLSAAYNLSRSLTLTARAQTMSTSQPNFIANEPPVAQKLFRLEISRSF